MLIDFYRMVACLHNRIETPETMKDLKLSHGGEIAPILENHKNNKPNDYLVISFSSFRFHFLGSQFRVSALSFARLNHLAEQ